MKNRYRGIIVPLFIPVLLSLSCIAFAERVEDVPNPRRQSGSFVADTAGILGSEYIGLIDEISRELKAGTGAELAVAAISSLGGLSEEEFAVKLFQQWGVGEKGKDNGILILFALQDRAVRIEVGYGLEPVIPDNLAGRILDEEALPSFREGWFAKGIFLAALRTAKIIASDSGITLVASSPENWPIPAIPDASKKSEVQKNKSSRWLPSLFYGAFLLLFSVIGSIVTLFRFRRARAKVAKTKVISGGTVWIANLWVLAIAGVSIIMGVWNHILSSLIVFFIVAPASTILQSKLLNRRKRYLESYRLQCDKCGLPMKMIPENEDDALLMIEEVSEEQAGGMDYEFWRCGGCGHEERFAVKQNQASRCPKCNRRTLKTTRTTLVAATTSHGGRIRITRTCLNPNCGFHESEERNTPRISSSSSGSGGGSHSSSSFGGGRSGGGGASRRF